MITVNMHEAKTRLSELVDAAEHGEVVILCRRGQPAVRLTPERASAPLDRTALSPNPKLQGSLAPGFDPAEPLSDDEWPAALR
jgi:prevent-host-death family protein